MLILGAGPAGLATALACHRFGLECRILDRYDDLVRGPGGLQITPNGMAVLSHLGLADPLAAVAEPATRITIAHLATGQRLSDIATRRLTGTNPVPYILLKRSDLIRCLRDAVLAAGIPIETGRCVTRLEATRDGIAWQTTSGHAGVARAIVGADGINSLVRSTILGPSTPPPPRYRVWRTTVAAAGSAIEPGHVSLHVDRGRHLVRYRAGRHGDGNGMGDVNVVAVEEIREPQDDSPQEPPAWLAGRLPVTAASFVDPAGLVHTLATGTLHANAWYRERMCLIGDALHPMLPFLAQGTNMALEDAHVLARSLAGAGDLAAGFERYRQERTKRIGRVIRFSNHQAWLNHGLLPRLGPRGAAGLRILNTVWPDLLARRYRWILTGDVIRS